MPIQAIGTAAVEAAQRVAVQPTIQNSQQAWAKPFIEAPLPQRAAERVRGRGRAMCRVQSFLGQLAFGSFTFNSSEEMSRDKAEQAIASTAPTALDEPSCGGTYCVTPDTERAGIANSVKQLSPSTEPLSRVTPDHQPVQSLKEPIASPAPTARDEPSGPEERRQRPRRWWSWRELVR